MRMKLIKPLFLLLLCLFMISGCSDGSDGPGSVGGSGVGSSAERIDVVIKSILNARAVSEEIAFLRCCCYDSQGRRVYGPKELPKADKVILQDVPIYCASIRVDYLNINRSPIGLYTEGLDFAAHAGSYEIINPEWENIESVSNIESLQINADKNTIYVNENVKFYAQAKCTDGDNTYYQDFTDIASWSSSNSKVAASSGVSSVFIGLQPGQTEITASLGELSASENLKVIAKSSGGDSSEHSSDDKPAQSPSDEDTAEPVGDNEDNSGDNSTSDPGVASTTEPGDNSTSDPGVASTTEPGDNSTSEPGDNSTSEPCDNSTEAPGDNPTEEPGDNPTEEPSDNPTEEFRDYNDAWDLNSSDVDNFYNDPSNRQGDVNNYTYFDSLNSGKGFYPRDYNVNSIGEMTGLMNLNCNLPRSTRLQRVFGGVYDIDYVEEYLNGNAISLIQQHFSLVNGFYVSLRYAIGGMGKDNHSQFTCVGKYKADCTSYGPYDVYQHRNIGPITISATELYVPIQGSCSVIRPENKRHLQDVFYIISGNGKQRSVYNPYDAMEFIHANSYDWYNFSGGNTQHFSITAYCLYNPAIRTSASIKCSASGVTVDNYKKGDTTWNAPVHIEDARVTISY